MPDTHSRTRRGSPPGAGARLGAKRQSAAGGAVFDAIADPIRRGILDGLRRGPQNAGEIARWFRVSRPAVSRHLRVLRRATLVREERLGRRRMYRLEPGPLAEIDRWLAAYRVFWAARLLDLKEMLESEPFAGAMHRRCNRDGDKAADRPGCIRAVL